MCSECDSSEDDWPSEPMSDAEDYQPEPITFGDRDLSDVTLIVEKQEFHVHKMVLASRSDEFKAMFYGYFKEAKQDRIEIKEVSAAAFQYFLQILYNGAVENKYFDSVFPGRCCGYVYEYPRKKQMKAIFNPYSNLLQLLAVADRFNLFKMVMHELKATFGTEQCEDDHCFRCITICRILSDRDENFAPYNKCFDHFALYVAYRVAAEEAEGIFIRDHSEKTHLQKLWRQFGNHERVPTVFGDHKTCDVTLIIEKHQFFVHQEYLASRSKFFKKLFYEAAAKAERNYMELFYGYPPGYQHRIELPYPYLIGFRLLLTLLYDGAIKAHQYLFPGCCNHDSVAALYFNNFKKRTICEIWSSDSGVYQLFKLVDELKTRELKKLVLTGIRKAFSEISCHSENCIRCIGIHLFLVDKRVQPIERKFDEATVAAVKEVFVEEAPNRAKKRRLS